MALELSCWETENDGVNRVDYVDIPLPSASSINGENPADPAVDDWLVIILQARVNSDNPQWDNATYNPRDASDDSDAGFSLAAEIGSAATAVHLGVFRKKVTGTEPALIRVPGFNTNVFTIGTCFLIKGGASGDIIGTIGSAFLGDTPIVAPGILVNNANSRVLIPFAFDGADASTPSFSTGFTGLFTEYDNPPNSFGLTGGLAYKNMTAIELSGDATITITPIDGAASIQIELVPETVVTPPAPTEYTYYNDMEILINGPVAGQGATNLYIDIIDAATELTSQIGGAFEITPMPAVGETLRFRVPKSWIQGLDPDTDYIARVWYEDADTVAPGNYSDYNFSTVDTPILAADPNLAKDAGNTDETTAAFTASAGAMWSGAGTIKVRPYFMGPQLAPDPSFSQPKGNADTGWRERDGFDFWSFAGGIATYAGDGINESWLFTKCCTKDQVGSRGTIKVPFTCTQGYLTFQNGFTDPIIAERFDSSSNGDTVECTFREMTSEYLVVYPSKDFVGTFGTGEYREGEAQLIQAGLNFEKTVPTGTDVIGCYELLDNSEVIQSDMSKQVTVTSDLAVPPTLVAESFGPITIRKNSTAEENIIDVLAHVTADSTVDPTLVSEVGAAANGTSGITAAEDFATYEPDVDFVGYDYFQWKAKDSDSPTPTESGYAVVVLNVVDVANIDFVTIPTDLYILSGHKYSFDVKASYDGSLSTTWNVSATNGAAVTITPDNTNPLKARIQVDTKNATDDFVITVTIGDASVNAVRQIAVELAPPYGSKPSSVIY